eukprot:COSAG05_NODE_2578_length_2878_cov_1.755308_5_plen_234_part_00
MKDYIWKRTRSHRLQLHNHCCLAWRRNHSTAAILRHARTHYLWVFVLWWFGLGALSNADCQMCTAGGSAAGEDAAAAAGLDDEDANDCGGWGTVNVHVSPSFHVCRSVLSSERHVGMPRVYPTELPKAPEIDLDLDSLIQMTEFRPTFLKLLRICSWPCYSSIGRSRYWADTGPMAQLGRQRQLMASRRAWGSRPLCYWRRGGFMRRYDFCNYGLCPYNMLYYIVGHVKTMHD